MELKKVIEFILIACAWIQSSEAIECTPNFCEKIQCPVVKCGPHQMLRRKSDLCGCCDVCTVLLGIGQPCMSLRGPPATAQCEKYLVCMHRRCIPMYRVSHS
ncbi:hypothetical protein CDAR_612781 [Caerostris darwini]|uniref:Uncharacterized protein n=1 Tax=Caerostris darwini TaxID=1538125 RepID=A0AAV4WK05_9ARAC|nr:hypothetical protein CDAR_612781 [Caerostris darwini]